MLGPRTMYMLEHMRGRATRQPAKSARPLRVGLRRSSAALRHLPDGRASRCAPRPGPVSIIHARFGPSATGPRLGATPKDMPGHIRGGATRARAGPAGPHAGRGALASGRRRQRLEVADTTAPSAPGPVAKARPPKPCGLWKQALAVCHGAGQQQRAQIGGNIAIRESGHEETRPASGKG